MAKKGTKTGTNSYGDLKSILSRSDAHPSGKGVCAFYHKDKATTSWNREHTWPNSRGAGKNVGLFAGVDPQVVRPTITTDNSARGRKMFAETGAYDPASLGYPDARGECARIILYAATRYYLCSPDKAGGSFKGSGVAGLELTNNVNDNAENGTMGKLSDLLKWNRLYPVTRAEKYRNDYLASINYARNPYIDHPEWADYVWDNAGVRKSPYKTDLSFKGAAITF